jgi:hypothetical protein
MSAGRQEDGGIPSHLTIKDTDLQGVYGSGTRTRDLRRDRPCERRTVKTIYDKAGIGLDRGFWRRDSHGEGDRAGAGSRRIGVERRRLGEGDAPVSPSRGASTLVHLHPAGRTKPSTDSLRSPGGFDPGGASGPALVTARLSVRPSLRRRCVVRCKARQPATEPTRRPAGGVRVGGIDNAADLGARGSAGGPGPVRVQFTSVPTRPPCGMTKGSAAGVSHRSAFGGRA